MLPHEDLRVSACTLRYEKVSGWRDLGYMRTHLAPLGMWNNVSSNAVSLYLTSGYTSSIAIEYPLSKIRGTLVLGPRHS